MEWKVQRKDDKDTMKAAELKPAMTRSFDCILTFPSYTARSRLKRRLLLEPHILELLVVPGASNHGGANGNASPAALSIHEARRVHAVLARVLIRPRTE